MTTDSPFFDSPEGDSDDALSHLLGLGNELVSGVAGAAAGLSIAGPPGAFAGAVGGPVLKRVLDAVAGEIARWRLGPRELQRTGAVFRLTLGEIQRELDSGRGVRQDNFFSLGSAGVGRTSADEVLEALLLAAQRDPEERKIPYYARLMKNVAFSEAIGVYDAHNLMRLLKDLNYRQ